MDSKSTACFLIYCLFLRVSSPPSYLGLGTLLPQLPGSKQKFPPKLLNFIFCTLTILPIPLKICIPDSLKMATPKWSSLTDCFNKVCTLLVPEHLTESGQQVKQLTIPGLGQHLSFLKFPQSVMI